MAEWLRHPPVETLVVTGSDPGLAKNLFFHFLSRRDPFMGRLVDLLLLVLC